MLVIHVADDEKHIWPSGCRCIDGDVDCDPAEGMEMRKTATMTGRRAMMIDCKDDDEDGKMSIMMVKALMVMMLMMSDEEDDDNDDDDGCDVTVMVMVMMLMMI